MVLRWVLTFCALHHTLPRHGSQDMQQHTFGGPRVKSSRGNVRPSYILFGSFARDCMTYAATWLADLSQSNAVSSSSGKGWQIDGLAFRLHRLFFDFQRLFAGIEALRPCSSHVRSMLALGHDTRPVQRSATRSPCRSYRPRRSELRPYTTAETSWLLSVLTGSRLHDAQRLGMRSFTSNASSFSST